MRDWLFRILFPKQHEKLRLFKTGNGPDFRLSAPEGMYFKVLNVYLVTDASGNAINCQWLEFPCEE